MNQTPEQLAKDEIDRQLVACGWVIQDKKTFNLSAGPVDKGDMVL
jgi:type I restriction enzyme R subunit